MFLNNKYLCAPQVLHEWHQQLIFFTDWCLKYTVKYQKIVTIGCNQIQQHDNNADIEVQFLLTASVFVLSLCAECSSTGL